MYKIRQLLSILGHCWLPALGLVILLCASLPAGAQSISIDLGGPAGAAADEDVPAGGANSITGRILQLIALISVLSVAPGILVTVTSFTRIVVVLSLLRSAIGTQTSPPNIVLISLALFLTAFVMAPTFQKSYQDGILPLMEERIEAPAAFERTVAPLRQFMLSQVRESDLQLFLDLSKSETPATPEATPIQALIPAFIISELKRAFEIGFLLFIPFIVIDMVVSSVLMSMGMMMLPPIMISLPFKLIFFVLVDGWGLVASSLVRSFEP
ncbi:MAG: flagellar type III secretion system pore protein FliP [Pseudomonadota bacterium]